MTTDGEMANRLRAEPAQVVGERREPLLLLLLERQPEVADAHLIRLGLRPVRPDAGVLARIHGDTDAVAQVHGLTTSDAEHPVERNASALHHPDCLVAADQPCRGVPHDALGAPEVIKVQVTDDDPVAGVDIVRAKPRAGGARHAVDVPIEKHGEPRCAQAEGRASVPVERRGHGVYSSSPCSSSAPVELRVAARTR